MANADSRIVSSTLGTTLRRGSSGAEVRQVQEMLNLAGSRPHLPTTGVFGELTEQSVRHFQSSHALGVDGRVGRQTFDALVRAVRSKTTLQAIATTPSGSGGTAPHAPAPAHDAPPVATTGAGEFCFPLDHVPSPSWKTGARYFGAPRDGGRRLHAGCDLLGPKGTTIYAVADGTLVRPPYYFYTGTYAVEIRHHGFIVRYGEILGGSYIGGHTVRKGQPICQIGRLDSGSSMLHFEMYSHGASDAPLTTGSGPYKRRSDLINPSPYLDEWMKNLPRR
jgi:murein DD-endopeptidase MepM/ murein hydrolase activator NlpD